LVVLYSQFMMHGQRNIKTCLHFQGTLNAWR